MPLFIILIVAGVALLQRQGAVPPLVWAAGLLPLLLCAWLVRRRRWLRLGIIAVCCFATGFFYAATRAQLRLNDALPPAWEGREV